MIALASFFLFLPLCDRPPAKPAAAVTKGDSRRSPEDETDAEFARVRRIYVDILTGGEEALKFRDMIISSLQRSRVFLITEDEDKADAVLKGSAADDIFTDHHDLTEGITAHANLGRSSGWRDRYDGANSSESNGLGIGDHESSHIDERKHEAVAALRLVTKNGDVIWSSTQESLGGKFAGASVDVADRMARQLVEDYRSARVRRKP